MGTHSTFMFSWRYIKLYTNCVDTPSYLVLHMYITFKCKSVYCFVYLYLCVPHSNVGYKVSVNT